jgi:uncharacterized membrane protein YedE/YeeE
VHHVLLERPPWYAAGLVFGLVVVAVCALVNEPLGVLGGFSSAVERATGRAATVGWKAYFLLGIISGGVLYSLLAGSFAGHGYGWLTRTFTGGSQWLTGVLLAAAGVLIGFGAKTAGGCTSGNGLAGCSFGSPASMLATATFFGTAIAASFLLRLVGAH